MIIGLHDAERDYMPKKTFPNLALKRTIRTLEILITHHYYRTIT